mmetsp:Transcript_22070/g.44286  ORF Transcript_22070/g.44286 Transcript_22070/m.44286 type:complete len:190 (-) Transcript_22070:308-877(-)
MSPKKHHQTASLWPTTTITTSRYHSTTSKSTNYNCTLTTLVRSLTTLRNSFYTPHHFPKFLFGFMTVSGVAGYYCMEYWYEKSVGERNEIYSAAYHQQHGGGGGGVMKRQRTVRDGHYEGRKKLFFDGVMEWLSPYQQRMLPQQQQQQQDGSNSGQEQEGRLTTLANRLTTAAPNHQPMSLQRQVTKFW